jgi:hypothetical protein
MATKSTGKNPTTAQIIAALLENPELLEVFRGKVAGTAVASKNGKGKKATNPGTDDFTYEVEYKGTYTWLTFSAKPAEAIRKAMSVEGGRFKGKTSQWYFNRKVDPNALNTMLGQPPEDVVITEFKFERRTGK